MDDSSKRDVDGGLNVRFWSLACIVLAAGCGAGDSQGQDPAGQDAGHPDAAGSELDATPGADSGPGLPDAGDSQAELPTGPDGGVPDAPEPSLDATPEADSGPDSADASPQPTWKDLELESSRMALRGIVRYVGAHYQSCAPLLDPELPPDQVMIDHYAQPTSYTDPASCVDRRDADFRYLTFGNIFEDQGSGDPGEVSLDPNAGRMRLYQGELDSFVRVHCTGALAGSVAAADMKYHVGQTAKGYSPNTNDIETLIATGQHCFYNPPMTRDFSLLPGDIINVSAAHAVRVYEIGDDPLGLKQVQSIDDCDEIFKENLDFTFMHSTSCDFYSGVHFQHTSNSTPNLIGKLAKAVRQMCRDNYNNGDIAGELPVLDLGEREFLGGLVSLPMRLRVLRHVGPSVPECVWDPEMPVRSDECLLDSCYDQVLARAHFPPTSP
jgi:hypothetical protein